MLLSWPGGANYWSISDENDLSGCGPRGLGTSGECKGQPPRPTMAFHGSKRQHEFGYSLLVRAQHPAMGDMLTRGQGSACWTEDGLEEAILSGRCPHR